MFTLVVKGYNKLYL